VRDRRSIYKMVT